MLGLQANARLFHHTTHTVNEMLRSLSSALDLHQLAGAALYAPLARVLRNEGIEGLRALFQNGQVPESLLSMVQQFKDALDKDSSTTQTSTEPSAGGSGA